MKTKALLALRVLMFATLCLAAGQAFAAEAKAPLAANEARVTGHKSAMAYKVLVTPAPRREGGEWKSELVIPAGPVRVAVSYHAFMSGGAVGAGAEAYNVVELAFDAEAGHEYYAEMWGMTIFNMGFKITDKTTGKIAAQAKVKDQKKAEKEAAKPTK